jgi:hypothetical protein
MRIRQFGSRREKGHGNAEEGVVQQKVVNDAEEHSTALIPTTQEQQQQQPFLLHVEKHRQTS